MQALYWRCLGYVPYHRAICSSAKGRADCSNSARSQIRNCKHQAKDIETTKVADVSAGCWFRFCSMIVYWPQDLSRLRNTSASSICMTFSYTRKVIADWGMTRSTLGTRPLYRPPAPSRCSISLKVAMPSRYCTARFCACLCCNLARTYLKIPRSESSLSFVLSTQTIATYSDALDAWHMPCQSCTLVPNPWSYIVDAHDADTPPTHMHCPYCSA